MGNQLALNVLFYHPIVIQLFLSVSFWFVLCEVKEDIAFDEDIDHITEITRNHFVQSSKLELS